MAASLRSYEPRDADAVVELSRAALSRPELHVGNPIWTVRDELETEIADWEPPATETLCVAEGDGESLLAGAEEPDDVGLARPARGQPADLEIESR